MAPRAPRPLSLDEYLALEERAAFKSEFAAGVIYAMAGGTAEHSAIATNVASLLRQALKGKECRAYNSDLRIYVP